MKHKRKRGTKLTYPPEPIICPVCKKEFSPRAYQKYCSRKCAVEFAKFRMKQRYHNLSLQTEDFHEYQNKD